MRPLQLVNPVDLIPGRTYLIREKRPEYAHLNCKGTFVKNDYPHHEYQCTITHFTNVIITGNKKSTKELRSGALNILNKYIEEVMKRDGYRIIMTVTGTPVLKKMFSDEDYILSGKDYNEYIKIL